MADRPTIGQAFATGCNRFDRIRLGAALLVLASHSYVLTGHASDEPVAPLLGHVTDGGGLAVGVFFVLSGFLIARSALVHPWARYVRGRVLRLYPAYLVVIVLQALVLGPVMSAWAPAAYFGEVWGALARALAFSAPAGLPGVFGGVPAAGQVNGSLWTLRIEVLCYIGLLGLAGAGMLRPGRVLGVAAVGWLALAAVRLGPADPRAAAIVDCGLHFAMGAVLWVYRDRVRVDGRLAAGGVALFGVALFGAAAWTWAGPAVLHLVLPYLVLWAGLVRARGRGRVPDISYGTYLAAFPLQQVVVGLAPGIGPVGLMAVAAPLALAYGAASWRMIEAPALGWVARRA